MGAKVGKSFPAGKWATRVAHARDQHLLRSCSKAIQTVISFPGLLVLLYSLPSMHYPAKTLGWRGRTKLFLKKKPNKQNPNLFGFSSLFSGPRVLCSNFGRRGCGFIWHQMHNFLGMMKEGHILTTLCQLVVLWIICLARVTSLCGGNWFKISFKICVVLSSRRRFLSHWRQKCVRDPLQPLLEGMCSGSAFAAVVLFRIR